MFRLDVFPRPSLQDVLHSTWTDAVVAGKLVGTHIAASIARSNITDLFWAQLGCVMPTGAAGGRMRLTAFSHHIGHIRLVISEKQVIRADAVPDIALVEDESASGYRPIMQFIRMTVCPNIIILAVTISVAPTSPKPASIGLAHFVPKVESVGKALMVALGAAKLALASTDLAFVSNKEGAANEAVTFKPRRALGMLYTVHAKPFTLRYGHGRGCHKHRSAISMPIIPYFAAVQAFMAARASAP